MESDAGEEEMTENQKQQVLEIAAEEAREELAEIEKMREEGATNHEINVAASKIRKKYMQRLKSIT